MADDPFLTAPYEPQAAVPGPDRGEIAQLAQYRIVRPLGAGGMGLVFEAEDQQLRRSVALKVMKPTIADDPASRTRFLQEARAAAALKHDHIVTVYQVGEDRGVPFLAMELLKGKSLEEWLRPDRRASVSETLTIGRQMLKGLEAAHTAGLVHRDIKPANLWLESPRGRVKILDFGLARMRAFGVKGPKGEREIVGTPAYMAPEQARGEMVDRRCDLFSVGCVFYRMLTGQLPFAGRSTHEMLQAVESQSPSAVGELNADVPARLSRLIERLLSKNAAARPATAQAVLEELQEIEKESKAAVASTVPTASTVESGNSGGVMLSDAAPQRFVRRGLALGIGLVGAVLAMAWLTRGEPPVAPRPVISPSLADSAATPPADIVLPAGTVDLLALVERNRDALRGRWILSGGTMMGHHAKNETADLILPWNPPLAYRLSMTITRLNTEDGAVGIGLASGEARFLLLLDAEGKRGFISGIIDSDWRTPEGRSDVWRGRLLRVSSTVHIVCAVEPGKVVVTCDGRVIDEWEGDLAELTRSGSTPPADPLYLSCRSGSHYGFSEVLLESLVDGEIGEPLKPPF